MSEWCSDQFLKRAKKIVYVQRDASVLSRHLFFCLRKEMAPKFNPPKFNPNVTLDKIKKVWETFHDVGLFDKQEELPTNPKEIGKLFRAVGTEITKIVFPQQQQDAVAEVEMFARVRSVATELMIFANELAQEIFSIWFEIRYKVQLSISGNKYKEKQTDWMCSAATDVIHLISRFTKVFARSELTSEASGTFKGKLRRKEWMDVAEEFSHPQRIVCRDKDAPTWSHAAVALQDDFIKYGGMDQAIRLLSQQKEFKRLFKELNIQANEFFDKFPPISERPASLRQGVLSGVCKAIMNQLDKTNLAPKLYAASYAKMNHFGAVSEDHIKSELTKAGSERLMKCFFAPIIVGEMTLKQAQEKWSGEEEPEAFQVRELKPLVVPIDGTAMFCEGLMMNVPACGIHRAAIESIEMLQSIWRTKPGAEQAKRSIQVLATYLETYFSKGWAAIRVAEAFHHLFCIAEFAFRKVGKDDYHTQTKAHYALGSLIRAFPLPTNWKWVLTGNDKVGSESYLRNDQTVDLKVNGAGKLREIFSKTIEEEKISVSFGDYVSKIQGVNFVGLQNPKLLLRYTMDSLIEKIITPHPVEYALSMGENGKTKEEFRIASKEIIPALPSANWRGAAQQAAFDEQVASYWAFAFLVYKLAQTVRIREHVAFMHSSDRRLGLPKPPSNDKGIENEVIRLLNGGKMYDMRYNGASIHTKRDTQDNVSLSPENPCWMNSSSAGKALSKHIWNKISGSSGKGRTGELSSGELFDGFAKFKEDCVLTEFEISEIQHRMIKLIELNVFGIETNTRSNRHFGANVIPPETSFQSESDVDDDDLMLELESDEDDLNLVRNAISPVRSEDADADNEESDTDTTTTTTTDDEESDTSPNLVQLLEDEEDTLPVLPSHEMKRQREENEEDASNDFLPQKVHVPELFPTQTRTLSFSQLSQRSQRED